MFCQSSFEVSASVFCTKGPKHTHTISQCSSALPSSVLPNVTGTAPADAFTLPAPVVNGGFQYTLHQVGNEWFLKSSAYVAPGVAPVPALSHLGLLLTGGLLAGVVARARRVRKKA